VKNDHRPVNIDLTDLFAWPAMAYVSILHRIAGVVLFVGIGFGLYALDMSLSSANGFETVRGLMKSPVGMFITWGLLTGLAFHFVAGIKHLLMDFGIGETLEGARFGSRITMVISIILAGLVAVWVI